MTLGPSLLLLAALDGRTRAMGPLEVYGRVPMFFYLLHVPLITVSAGFVHLIMTGHFTQPETYGGGPLIGVGPFGLVGVYLVWIAIVVALYLPCRTWGALKRRHADWRWLSYL
jgi:hypothetical protein